MNLTINVKKKVGDSLKRQHGKLLAKECIKLFNASEKYRSNNPNTSVKVDFFFNDMSSLMFFNEFLKYMLRYKREKILNQLEFVNMRLCDEKLFFKEWKKIKKIEG